MCSVSSGPFFFFVCFRTDLNVGLGPVLRRVPRRQRHPPPPLLSLFLSPPLPSCLPSNSAGLPSLFFPSPGLGPVLRRVPRRQRHAGGRGGQRGGMRHLCPAGLPHLDDPVSCISKYTRRLLLLSSYIHISLICTCCVLEVCSMRVVPHIGPTRLPHIDDPVSSACKRYCSSKL
jgi:hypothetical protein